MVLHRPLQIFLRRASGKLERRIQGVQFEEIAMRAGRRTGSSIADASKSDMPCLALLGAHLVSTHSPQGLVPPQGYSRRPNAPMYRPEHPGHRQSKPNFSPRRECPTNSAAATCLARHTYISWESFHLPQMRRMRVSSANLLCPREIRIKSLLGRVSDPHCRASSSTSIAELGQQSKESWAVRRDALPHLSPAIVAQ